MGTTGGGHLPRFARSMDRDEILVLHRDIFRGVLKEGGGTGTTPTREGKRGQTLRYTQRFLQGGVGHSDFATLFWASYSTV